MSDRGKGGAKTNVKSNTRSSSAGISRSDLVLINFDTLISNFRQVIFASKTMLSIRPEFLHNCNDF